MCHYSLEELLLSLATHAGKRIFNKLLRVLRKTHCSRTSSSAAVSRNFSSLVQAKIARAQEAGLPADRAAKIYNKCNMVFDSHIKDSFRNNGQKWVVDVDEGEFPDADIEEGYMIFTCKEILSTFEPVVDSIIALIKDQVFSIRGSKFGQKVRKVPNPSIQTVGPSEFLIDVSDHHLHGWRLRSQRTPV